MKILGSRWLTVTSGASLQNSDLWNPIELLDSSTDSLELVSPQVPPSSGMLDKSILPQMWVEKQQLQQYHCLLCAQAQREEYLSRF